MEISELTTAANAPPNAHLFYIDRSALLNANGAPRRLTAVIWTDPKVFSLLSSHFAVAVPAIENIPPFGRYTLRVPLVETVNANSPEAVLMVARHAPTSDSVVVSISVFADDELLAESLLPLTVSAGKPTQTSIRVPQSPLRPTTKDEGVLSLVETRAKHVQAFFATKEGLSTWQITAERNLADWPGYVSAPLSNRKPSTAGSILRAVLFPSGAYCAGDCDVAARSFDAWVLQARSQPIVDSLLVQSLPIQDDQNWTPVMLPIGAIPLSAPKNDLPSETDQHPAATIAEPVGTEVLTLTSPRAEDSASVLPTSDATPSSHIGGAAELNSPAAASDPAALNLSVERRGEAVLADPIDATVLLYDYRSALNLGDEYTYVAFSVLPRIAANRAIATPPYPPCAGDWSLFLPPNVPDPNHGLDAARAEMSDILGIYQAARRSSRFEFVRSLDPLKQRSGASSTSNWAIVAHYDSSSGILSMPATATSDSEVSFGELRRKLSPPGVILLLACDSGSPSDNRFLQTLMENGGSTIIATTSLLPGVVAGQFLTQFMSVLAEAGRAGVRVGDAYWQTLHRLPQQSQYAIPRFVLSGDPDVRLCAPTLTR